MKSLKTIKADEIKLDRIFITNIKEGSYNYNLIKNILNFSTLYIKRVVCEGVETVDELNTLNSLMDTIVQGFLFSKPLTIDEFFNTYCNKLAEEYIEYNLKLNNIKEKLKEVKYFNFNHPKFLRETNLGLWVLKVNLETNNYKMYIDDTSKVMFGLPDEIDPSKCFYLWADDFAKNNINIYDYVNELLNTKHMVDLECPWHHPKFGDVKIRMFGKLTEQDNNNITFKGYQRLLFNK